MPTIEAAHNIFGQENLGIEAVMKATDPFSAMVRGFGEVTSNNPAFLNGLRNVAYSDSPFVEGSESTATGITIENASRNTFHDLIRIAAKASYYNALVIEDSIANRNEHGFDKYVRQDLETVWKNGGGLSSEQGREYTHLEGDAGRLMDVLSAVGLPDELTVRFGTGKDRYTIRTASNGNTINDRDSAYGFTLPKYMRIGGAITPLVLIVACTPQPAGEITPLPSSNPAEISNTAAASTPIGEMTNTEILVPTSEPTTNPTPEPTFQPPEIIQTSESNSQPAVHPPEIKFDSNGLAEGTETNPEKFVGKSASAVALERGNLAYRLYLQTNEPKYFESEEAYVQEMEAFVEDNHKGFVLGQTQDLSSNEFVTYIYNPGSGEIMLPFTPERTMDSSRPDLGTGELSPEKLFSPGTAPTFARGVDGNWYLVNESSWLNTTESTRSNPKWEANIGSLPDHWNSPEVMAQVQEKMDQYPDFFNNLEKYTFVDDNPQIQYNDHLLNTSNGFEYTHEMPKGAVGIFSNKNGVLVTTVEVQREIPGMGKVTALLGMTKMLADDGVKIDVPVLFGWKDSVGHYSSVVIAQQIGENLGAQSSTFGSYEEIKAYFNRITADKFVLLGFNVGTVDGVDGKMEIEKMISLLIGPTGSMERNAIRQGDQMEKMLRSYFTNGLYDLNFGAREFPGDLGRKLSNDQVGEKIPNSPFGVIDRVCIQGRLEIDKLIP